MTTIILAFFAMLTLMTAMAVGVIFGRKPIAGTCGGMKALGMEVECEICGGNPEVCDSPNSDDASVSAYAEKTELSQRVGK